MTDKIGVLFLFAQNGVRCRRGSSLGHHPQSGSRSLRCARGLHRRRTATALASRFSTPSRSSRTCSLRPTRFAPSLGRESQAAVLRGVRSTGAFSADFLALRRYVVRERIRIVHSTERPRDAAYNVALAKLAGARSVVHVHVKWSNEYSALARWGVQRADAVFSISRYVTSTLLDMGTPGAQPSTPSRTASTRRNGIRASTAASCAASSASRAMRWCWRRCRACFPGRVNASSCAPSRWCALELQNVRLLIVGADSLEARRRLVQCGAQSAGATAWASPKHVIVHRAALGRAASHGCL